MTIVNLNRRIGWYVHGIFAFAPQTSLRKMQPMKHVMNLAILAAASSLAGCASTQYQHVVSKDGQEIICQSASDAQDLGCYPRGAYEPGPSQGAAPLLHYSVEYNSQAPSPFSH
jgi:hypothetical protein